MKTLTELGGSLIRTAAAAVAEAKRSLPRAEHAAVVEAPVQAEAVEAPSAPPAEAGEATDAAAVAAAIDEGAPATAPEAGDAAVPAAAAPATHKKAAKGEPAEEHESEAMKAAFDAAVEKATGLSGDRLARLREAVKVVGSRVKDVRLVRVFGSEEPVAGAKAVGGFQYVVDLSPSNMKQTFADPKKDRGGRGGGGGGGGGGRGGGSGGVKAGATGGFSMDSLREDRKGQRPGGGRSGGGKKPGGGGAPRGK